MKRNCHLIFSLLSHASSGFTSKNTPKFLIDYCSSGDLLWSLAFNARESLLLWLYRNLLMVIYNGKWIFDRFHFTLPHSRRNIIISLPYSIFPSLFFLLSHFVFTENSSLSACHFSFYFIHAVKRNCNWNRSKLFLIFPNKVDS